MEVYKAIAAVQGELAKTGISKTRKNSQGSGYMFRGIDDVYAALSPLLSAHGLCVIPRMMGRDVVERSSKSGGALFYTTVKAEFDFVAVSDGSKHTACTYGEAMDSGDKSTNKAMSAAYKYAAFLTFAIPTEGDNDADGSTHDVAPRQNNVSTLRQDLEQSVEQTTRKQPERLKGPIKTRAELRKACGELVREIHSCGDIDQFEALLADQKPLIEQVQEEHEFFWLGDGADFLGLQKEINRMRAHLEQEVEGHNEAWRTSALAAG